MVLLIRCVHQLFIIMGKYLREANLRKGLFLLIVLEFHSAILGGPIGLAHDDGIFAGGVPRQPEHHVAKERMYHCVSSIKPPQFDCGDSALKPNLV